MHNIKKSVAMMSILIISVTGIYLYNDNTTPNKAEQASVPSDNHNADNTQQYILRSSIVLRKKTTATDSHALSEKVILLADINMPASLASTDPSSLIHVDSDNQLVLNHDIKMLFDYFFSAEGDLTPAELLTSMQQYIKLTYPQPAAQQALALLDKYLDYKQQMQDFYAQDTALQDLPELNTLTDNDTLQTIEGLMQARQDMRDSVFTLEESDAMFGQDINYDQYMLTVAKLDSNLTPSERKQQIEQIAQQHLTTEQYQARKQTFILQSSSPNFSIDNSGECQGNSEEFTEKQVIALCQLARKRLARSESSS